LKVQRLSIVGSIAPQPLCAQRISAAQGHLQRDAPRRCHHIACVAPLTIKIRRALYWKFGKDHEKQTGEQGWMFVDPKSKHSVRNIDLSPMLRKKLLELCMRSDKKAFVCKTRKRTPINPDNMTSHKFKPAVKIANVVKVSWHDAMPTLSDWPRRDVRCILSVRFWDTIRSILLESSMPDLVHNRLPGQF
jgi:hypothetical protein